MSKKHYEKAAKIVQSWDISDKKLEQKTRRLIANAFADFFSDDNARFNRDRFLTACGVVE